MLPLFPLLEGRGGCVDVGVPSAPGAFRLTAIDVGVVAVGDVELDGPSDEGNGDEPRPNSFAIGLIAGALLATGDTSVAGSGTVGMLSLRVGGGGGGAVNLTVGKDGRDMLIFTLGTASDSAAVEAESLTLIFGASGAEMPIFKGSGAGWFGGGVDTLNRIVGAAATTGAGVAGAGASGVDSNFTGGAASGAVAVGAGDAAFGKLNFSLISVGWDA